MKEKGLSKWPWLTVARVDEAIEESMAVELLSDSIAQACGRSTIADYTRDCIVDIAVGVGVPREHALLLKDRLQQIALSHVGMGMDIGLRVAENATGVDLDRLFESDRNEGGDRNG